MKLRNYLLLYSCQVEVHLSDSANREHMSVDVSCRFGRLGGCCVAVALWWKEKFLADLIILLLPSLWWWVAARCVDPPLPGHLVVEIVSLVWIGCDVPHQFGVKCVKQKSTWVPRHSKEDRFVMLCYDVTLCSDQLITHTWIHTCYINIKKYIYFEMGRWVTSETRHNTPHKCILYPTNT